MRIALSLALPLLALGQTLTLTGPTTVTAGGSIAAILMLANPPASLAGLQWAVGLPSGWGASVGTGSATLGAGKAISCGMPKTQMCLAAGVGWGMYTPGAVALYLIAVPKGAKVGKAMLPLTGLLGSTLQANGVAVASGLSYSVNVRKP